MHSGIHAGADNTLLGLCSVFSVESNRKREDKNSLPSLPSLAQKCSTSFVRRRPLFPLPRMMGHSEPYSGALCIPPLSGTQVPQTADSLGLSQQLCNRTCQILQQCCWRMRCNLPCTQQRSSKVLLNVPFGSVGSSDYTLQHQSPKQPSAKRLLKV